MIAFCVTNLERQWRNSYLDRVSEGGGYFRLCLFLSRLCLRAGRHKWLKTVCFKKKEDLKGVFICLKKAMEYCFKFGEIMEE
ncbi:hypothetical protein Hanom_Chr05g00435321 [Helianthus anomalus]